MTKGGVEAVVSSAKSGIGLSFKCRKKSLPVSLLATMEVRKTGVLILFFKFY